MHAMLKMNKQMMHINFQPDRNSFTSDLHQEKWYKRQDVYTLITK